MDKRPLGIIGAVFFLTVLVLSRFGYEKSLFILPIFLLAVFLVFLKQRKLKFFTVISSAVFCASLLFGATDASFRTNENYFSGQNIAVEGVICERPYISNSKHYVIIKTDKLNGEDVKIKIRVNTVSLPKNATLYNNVKLKANLYKVNALDDGAMRGLKCKNICLTGTVADNSFKAYENEDKPFLYYILSFRYKIFDTIAELLPNDIGGFIAGITIGEKRLMSNELLEKFRITGTSHILVVSGLHVAIWSGFLFKLMRRFFSRKISSVASIVFLLFFIVFTGFTASVIRAGVTMILNYIAIIFSEKPDSLNTLGVSALVLTAVDPFSIYNAGTVFSFASVFGILLMNEYVMKFLKQKIAKVKLKLPRNLLKYSVSLILVSLSAQIFTYPVSVLFNLNFSFLSVVSNFFISSLGTFTMVTGGVGATLLSLIPDFILGKLSFGASITVSKVIISIIDKFSRFDFLYRNVTTIENNIFLLLVAILLFLIVFASMSAKKKTAVFASFLVPIFLVSNLLPSLYKTKVVEFAVIDVGYGMCISFSHGNETVMLSCSGDYGAVNKICDYLKYRGVEKIKAVYLPVNRNMALVSNVKDIKNFFDVESVVTSSEYKFSDICEKTISADYVDAQYFGGKVNIEFYTQKNCSFALVKTGDARILINFYGRLRQENLPQGCINPDIYVTMYENTYRTDFSATKEYIITNSFDTSVPVTAKNIHSTMNDSTYIKPILV